ncbi:hypothetical protein PISMIDRAFT_674259 [Pisolithus microcarpus 441]|uniref:Uncharacterized protein n=1 Tax=Pisolithus microcarpus 441 TaxID=765257 RepID=A0A0C9ZPG3_9AGAM|nr:hypothetical protein PISMIDRAFT_674259 [Pisolithus microcarpus 441]
MDQGSDEKTGGKRHKHELEGAVKWTHRGTPYSELLLLNIDGPTNSSRHCQRLPPIVFWIMLCCHVD